MAARNRAAMMAALRPCTWGSERPGSEARGAAVFILHTNPTNCLPIVKFGLKLVAAGANIARAKEFRHRAGRRGAARRGGGCALEKGAWTGDRMKVMTDLEAYVQQEGRAEMVRQVRAKIDEMGVSYIYYQFVSVTGRIVGKGVPADHWESICERGFQLVYGSSVDLVGARPHPYIGYGPEASELVGIPDPETFVQLPWDKRVARVFCTCFRNREERENPGGHLTSDCRGNLRLMHQAFK